jgi:hypothetical protein
MNISPVLCSETWTRGDEALLLVQNCRMWSTHPSAICIRQIVGRASASHELMLYLLGKSIECPFAYFEVQIVAVGAVFRSVALIPCFSNWNSLTCRVTQAADSDTTSKEFNIKVPKSKFIPSKDTEGTFAPVWAQSGKEEGLVRLDLLL